MPSLDSSLDSCTRSGLFWGKRWFFWEPLFCMWKGALGGNFTNIMGNVNFYNFKKWQSWAFPWSIQIEGQTVIKLRKGHTNTRDTCETFGQTKHYEKSNVRFSDKQISPYGVRNSNQSISDARMIQRHPNWESQYVCHSAGRDIGSNLDGMTRLCFLVW